MGRCTVTQVAIVAIQLLAAVVGCAAQAGGDPAAPDQVTLGETFTLAAGAMAIVRGEELQVGFDRVLSDSRCPRGGQCIAEGEAVIQVWLSKPPRGRAMHELRTAPAADAEAIYEDYRLRLVELAPYPQANRTVRPSDYRATLSVTR